ncbi:MAG: hypothetical protein ABIJ09_03560 [Pseudomonadota bacterium]
MSTRPEEPHLIVRVAGTSLALPISCVARLEEREAAASLDLAELCELAPASAQRAGRVALRTAAGIVVATLDAVEELVSQPRIEALPALTALTQPEVVRGLLILPGEPSSRLAIVLDGARLGDLIAERLYQRDAGLASAEGA